MLMGSMAWHVTMTKRILMRSSGTGVSDVAGEALQMATCCSTRWHGSSTACVLGPSTLPSGHSTLAAFYSPNGSFRFQL